METDTVVPKHPYYGELLPQIGSQVLGRVLSLETNGVLVSLPEYLDREVLVNYRDACKSARIHKIRQSLKPNQEYCFQVKSVDQITGGLGLSRRDLGVNDDREYQRSLKKYLWLFNLFKGYFYHHQIPVEEQNYLLKVTLWSHRSGSTEDKGSVDPEGDSCAKECSAGSEDDGDSVNTEASEGMEESDRGCESEEAVSKVRSCDCKELCELFGQIYLGDLTLKTAFPDFPLNHEVLFLEEIRSHLAGYNEFKGVGTLKIMSYGSIGEVHAFVKYLEEHLGTPVFLKSPPNYYFTLDNIQRNQQETKAEEVKSLITCYPNPTQQLNVRFEGFEWTSKFSVDNNL